MHEENVNVLLFELLITDCGGEALKVLAMISLEEECENHTRGFIYQITPNIHDKDEKPPLNPKERKEVNEERMVVESPTTPMNGNMGCQPKVLQGPTNLSFLLTEGT
jgi:hypothetical protein